MATNTKPRNEPPPASPAPALAPEPTSTIPPAPEISWQDVLATVPVMDHDELTAAIDYAQEHVPAEARMAFYAAIGDTLNARSEARKAAAPQATEQPAKAPEVAPPPPPGSVQAIAAEYNSRKLGSAPFGGLSAKQGIVDPRGAYAAPAAPIDPALALATALDERARVAQHGIGLSARPASTPVLPLAYGNPKAPQHVPPSFQRGWQGAQANHFPVGWETAHQAGLGLSRQQPARQAVDVTRSVVQPSPAQQAQQVDYSQGLGLSRKGGSR